MRGYMPSHCNISISFFRRRALARTQVPFGGFWMFYVLHIPLKSRSRNGADTASRNYAG